LHIFLDGIEVQEELSNVSLKNEENSVNSFPSNYDEPPSISSSSSFMPSYAQTTFDWPDEWETSNRSLPNNNTFTKFNTVFSLPPPRPPPPKSPIFR
jgi:hypothetical protein